MFPTDLDEFREFSLLQFEPFDLVEEHPATGMDDISNHFPFVLTGLPSDACTIEFSEIFIADLIRGCTFPSTDSCHFWIIWGVVRAFCRMVEYINARKTVFGIRLLDYCPS